MPSKFNCGRSCHFLFHSIIPMIYLLFFLPGALWCCSRWPIISFSQDHVIFLLIHLTGVLCSHSSSFHLIKFCISFQPECCSNLIFLVPCLSRFNQSGSNSFLSMVLVFHSFATSKVHMVFLVSLFYRSALNCVQLCYVLSFNFSTSQGSLVSLIGQRSNLVLPLLFLFCFPSGAILDLGTRSSCSGGVL